MKLELVLKILRQNKIKFFFLTGVFSLFLLIILYGGRLIYSMETTALEGKAVSELDHDKKTVVEFFSACSNDLIFLKNLPGLTQYLQDKPQADRAMPVVRDTLFSFIKAHPYYKRISIIDFKGLELITVDNGSGVSSSSVRKEDLQRRGWDTESFIKAVSIGGDRIYASAAGFQDRSGISEPDTPSISIFTPVFASTERGKVLIVLDISISGLLEKLFENTHIQTDKGLVLGLGKDGAVEQRTGRIWNAEGIEKISDTENIYHSSVQYLPGNSLRLIKYFSYSDFKNSMKKIEIISVSIFAGFFVFILAFSFFNVNSFRRLVRAQKAIIYSLANLSEWRDPETGSHLERTRNFSVLLARTLRKNNKHKKILTNDFIEDLYDAVPLHDIGKVGIRDDILLKNERLSREEFESMKDHVLIGRDVIQDIIERFGIESTFLVVSRNICHYHHEKYNGSGYPLGLKGDEIPLEARIFALCDVYDALRSKRPYKQGLSHEETLEIIRAGRDIHFDPDIADALLECSDEFNEIFESYKLFDDTYGKVLKLRSRDALKVSWSDELSVGNEKIDIQHKEFFSRINAIFAATLKGEARKATMKEMRFLHHYAIYHFRTEEKIMKRYAYPDYRSHKEQHDLFFGNLAEIENDLEENGLSSSVFLRINANLVNWLIEHIMKTDKKLGSYIKSL